MARPKTYDEDTVLTAAMLCFWRRGYTATSMKHLEEATGLTPSSLYNSFSSKDSLFLRSLDHYMEKVVFRRLNDYLKTDDPVAGIQAYVLDCFRGKAPAQGCLLINTSTELGPHDDAVREKVADGMKAVEKALLAALMRAQQQGDIPQEADIQNRAVHIGLLMNGMLVNSCISRNKSWLDSAMGSIRNLLH